MSCAVSVASTSTLAGISNYLPTGLPATPLQLGFLQCLDGSSISRHRYTGLEGRFVLGLTPWRQVYLAALAIWNPSIAFMAYGTKTGALAVSYVCLLEVLWLSSRAGQEQSDTWHLSQPWKTHLPSWHVVCIFQRLPSSWCWSCSFASLMFTHSYNFLSSMALCLPLLSAAWGLHCLGGTQSSVLQTTGCGLSFCSWDQYLFDYPLLHLHLVAL